jgi:hypothetical protein
MKPTPSQLVKKNFESRAGLVDKLADMVDKQHGDSSKDNVKSRLMALPNKKLLRLYEVEQRVRERFGDKAGLIKHIMTKRTEAGLTADDALRTKLEGFTKKRLLDMTKQRHAARPKKQTAEQRLAGKHGRKERARAMEKVKGKN